MLQDFKKFILRGNVLDLAVAVILGIAFGVVVQSLVDNVVMQFIGGLFGKPSFRDALVLHSGDAVYLRLGSFLTDVVNFLLIAAAVFFIVKFITVVMEKSRRGAAEEDTPTPSDEAVLLAEIRDLLRSQQGR
jgi:large conductance mechanosensitive channel